MSKNIRFRIEQVEPNVFIAPGAIVVGDVSIGSDSSVWYHAVIRGDTESIRIGRESNIQDGCILHADPGFACTIGDRVTLGHGAIVHGATVADEVMIGMRAVVMNGVVIGTGSIIGAGAIVTEYSEIPAGSLVLGIPGKVHRRTDNNDQSLIQRAAQHYVEAGRLYSQELS